MPANKEDIKALRRRLDNWRALACRSDHQLAVELDRLEVDHQENRYNWPEASPSEYLVQVREAARERLRYKA